MFCLCGCFGIPYRAARDSAIKHRLHHGADCCSVMHKAKIVTTGRQRQSRHSPCNALPCCNTAFTSDTTNACQGYERTFWQKIHAIGNQHRFHRLLSCTTWPTMHHRALTDLSAEVGAKIRVKIRSEPLERGDSILKNRPYLQRPTLHPSTSHLHRQSRRRWFSRHLPPSQTASHTQTSTAASTL